MEVRGVEPLSIETSTTCTTRLSGFDSRHRPRSRNLGPDGISAYPLNARRSRQPVFPLKAFSNNSGVSLENGRPELGRDSSGRHLGGEINCEHISFVSCVLPEVLRGQQTSSTCTYHLGSYFETSTPPFGSGRNLLERKSILTGSFPICKLSHALAVLTQSGGLDTGSVFVA